MNMKKILVKLDFSKKNYMQVLQKFNKKRFAFCAETLKKLNKNITEEEFYSIITPFISKINCKEIDNLIEPKLHLKNINA